MPTSCFYFLPFYIDQKKSWDEPWNGFEGLGQYSNFKKTLIKYFCGYLSSEHFELEEDVFAQKAIEQEANQQVSRITDAMSVLDEVVLEQTIAFTQAELESIQQEIEKELTAFSAHQSSCLNSNHH